MTMKEKLINLFESKESCIKSCSDIESRKILFFQAFGALEMMVSVAENWDGEKEFIKLWNDEWRDRLETLVYGF